MGLILSDLSYPIGESEGLDEVAELEFTRQMAGGIQLPAITEIGQQLPGAIGIERRHAATTGYALLIGKVHAGIL